MLRCAITSEHYRAGDAARWASNSIDFVQLRAKTLDAEALANLGRSILSELAETQSSRTRLLINSRADVAIAIGAHGVHLTASENELTPKQVRALCAHAALAPPVVGVSCHTPDEVNRARDNRADLILFGAVFEKRVGDRLITAGVGLDALAAACLAARPVPVLALGGITTENMAACLAAGAAGIAGIRCFR